MSTLSRVRAVHAVEVSPRVKPELVVSGARGTHDRSDFLLIRVETDDGVEGFGEVSGTLTWSGEDAATAAVVLRRALVPAVLEQPLVPVARLDSRMDRVLAGHPFTKAGLSMALWDAHARSLDQPLAVVLGGSHREEVAIKCSLSGNDSRLRGVLDAARKAGFRSFKVKVGMDVDVDIARVAEVRDLVGPETFVGLDANGGYSRTAASTAIAAMREYRPAFFEQPVAPPDLVGMRALRTGDIPVLADESVFDMADLQAVIRADAADAVSLYVGKSRGPARAVTMGQVATAAGLEVVLGSNGELGIGAAAQLQVACALPGLSAFPSDIIGAHYYDEDVIDTDHDGGPVSDGRRVTIGSGAGLGVVPRSDLIDQLRRADTRIGA